MYTLWTYSDYWGNFEPCCDVPSKIKGKLIKYLKKEGFIKHYYCNFYKVAEICVRKYFYNEDSNEYEEYILNKDKYFNINDWNRWVKNNSDKVFKVIDEDDLEDYYKISIDGITFDLKLFEDVIGIYKENDKNYLKLSNLRFSGLAQDLEFFKTVY